MSFFTDDTEFQINMLLQEVKGILRKNREYNMSVRPIREKGVVFLTP
jgi:hypothetical protein